MEMLTILVGDFSNSRLLRIKPQGSFFIFSAILKTAIVEYHKSDCNQSRGSAANSELEGEGERGRAWNIYNI